jgi:vancomycin resistance protein YoaR
MGKRHARMKPGRGYTDGPPGAATLLQDMSRLLRWLLITVGAALGAALIIGGAFAIDRAIHAGQVLRNVRVADAELSGLGQPDARRALLILEDRLVTTPATFRVQAGEFELDPQTVGFRVDHDQALAAALRVGRHGSFLQQVEWWLRHLRRATVLDPPGSLDGPALELLLEGWATEAIDDPPFPGGVSISEGRPEPEYPQPGLGIDGAAARQLILETLGRPAARTAVIPVVMVDPPLTIDDVDAVVRQALILVGDAVTLRSDDPEMQVSFTPDQLASALQDEVVLASEPRIELSFDPARVAAVLQPLRQQLEVPPRDARFEINDDDTVSVVPGRSGTRIDPSTVATALFEAAQTSDRSGLFPFEQGAEPELTTEEAEALGITHRVSDFTTHHSCCQPRVSNIHLIADLVDGAIVRPGERFSVNDYVGARTADRGFLSAPVIYRGEYTQDVGGGVSQFATTFYNAAFFGGYQDVEHQPHSYYISRYPEGREATISWPAPDLVFRNDTEAGILIKTAYTDTSITVIFYGDNGGREVEAALSGRYAFTAPPTDYVGDPGLEPEQQQVVAQGGQGWSVTVYRTITYPDGRTESQEWPVRYRPQPTVLRVHPCKIPPGEEGHTGEPCPQPTTTSSPTTTAPPATTAPPNA